MPKLCSAVPWDNKRGLERGCRSRSPWSWVGRLDSDLESELPGPAVLSHRSWCIFFKVAESWTPALWRLKTDILLLEKGSIRLYLQHKDIYQTQCWATEPKFPSWTHFKCWSLPTRLYFVPTLCFSDAGVRLNFSWACLIWSTQSILWEDAGETPLHRHLKAFPLLRLCMCLCLWAHTVC